MKEELKKLINQMLKIAKEKASLYIAISSTQTEASKLYKNTTAVKKAEIFVQLYTAYMAGFSQGFAEARGIDEVVFMNTISEIMEGNL